MSFMVYNNGSGTLCNGSVLMNTASEPETGNGTGTFVVSQNGSRIDAVTTSATNSPVSDLEDEVSHVVAFKQ
jgi:hypothetical protein